jgi:hypothetical protein
MKLDATSEQHQRVVGSCIPERGQIGAQLPDRPLLLAGLARFDGEHVR